MGWEWRLFYRPLATASTEFQRAHEHREDIYRPISAAAGLKWRGGDDGCAELKVRCKTDGEFEKYRKLTAFIRAHKESGEREVAALLAKAAVPSPSADDGVRVFIHKQRTKSEQQGAWVEHAVLTVRVVRRDGSAILEQTWVSVAVEGKRTACQPLLAGVRTTSEAQAQDGAVFVGGYPAFVCWLAGASERVAARPSPGRPILPTDLTDMERELCIVQRGRDDPRDAGKSIGPQAPTAATAATMASSALCEVYIVRHGERVDEVPGAEQQQWLQSLCGADRFDPPLTRRGVQQAAESARTLRQLLHGQVQPFEAVYCSPLLRCVQTAEHFSAIFGIPITLVGGLGECCAALLATNPKAARRWPRLLPLEALMQRCPAASFTAPDATFPERFLSTPPLRTCAGRLAQGRPRVLLVSHRESIRALVAAQACRYTRDDMHTPYACVGVFACRGAGTPHERWQYQGLLRQTSAVDYEGEGDRCDPAAMESEAQDPGPNGPL